MQGYFRGRATRAKWDEGNTRGQVVKKEEQMTWTTPEFEIVALGMEVGAYAGNA